MTFLLATVKRRVILGNARHYVFVRPVPACTARVPLVGTCLAEKAQQLPFIINWLMCSAQAAGSCSRYANPAVQWVSGYVLQIWLACIRRVGMGVPNLQLTESSSETYLPSASHCLRRTIAFRLERRGGKYLFGPTCLNCSAASPSRRSKCDMINGLIQG